MIYSKKVCSRCKKEKPTSSFSKSNSNSDGLYYICKACGKKVREDRTANRSNITLPIEKICKRCGVVKPLSDFFTDNHTVTGKGLYCKPCKRLRIMELRAIAHQTLPSISEKKCSRCKKTKSISEYTLNAAQRDGYRKYCKICSNKMQQKNKAIRASRVIPVLKKICTRCGLEKSAEHYHKEYGSTDGLHAMCASCSTQLAKQRRQKPEVKHNLALREKEYRQQHKKQRQARANAREKLKYNGDIYFNLVSRLRKRIRSAVKGHCKSVSTLQLVGCSYEFFQEYFKSHFASDMTWDAYLKGDIHIDHIIPCSEFDLSIPENQRLCFNYRNMWPMWGVDNIRKYNHLDVELSIDVPWAKPQLPLEARKEALKQAIVLGGY